MLDSNSTFFQICSDSFPISDWFQLSEVSFVCILYATCELLFVVSRASLECTVWLHSVCGSHFFEVGALSVLHTICTTQFPWWADERLTLIRKQCLSTKVQPHAACAFFHFLLVVIIMFSSCVGKLGYSPGYWHCPDTGRQVAMAHFKDLGLPRSRTNACDCGSNQVGWDVEYQAEAKQDSRCAVLETFQRRNYNSTDCVLTAFVDYQQRWLLIATEDNFAASQTFVTSWSSTGLKQCREFFLCTVRFDPGCSSIGYVYGSLI